ncbi:MAG: hypothetical protein ACFFAQ_13025 [Promethearchaeota archaeon]
MSMIFHAWLGLLTSRITLIIRYSMRRNRHFFIFHTISISRMFHFLRCTSARPIPIKGVYHPK